MMNDYLETREYTNPTTTYIFCTMAELPCATYLGNCEWVDRNGQHYIVED